MYVRINDLAFEMNCNFFTNDSEKRYLDISTGEIYKKNEIESLLNNNIHQFLDLPIIPYYEFADAFLNVCMNKKQKQRFKAYFNPDKMEFRHEMYKLGLLKAWYNFYFERLIDYAKNWCNENNIQFSEKFYYKKNGGLFSTL